MRWGVVARAAQSGWRAVLPSAPAHAEATTAVLTQLDRAGFHTPTNTQNSMLGPMGSGKDLVVIAETGSGKTLGYLTPLAIRALEFNARYAEQLESNARQAALMADETSTDITGTFPSPGSGLSDNHGDHSDHSADLSNLGSADMSTLPDEAPTSTSLEDGTSPSPIDVDSVAVTRPESTGDNASSGRARAPARATVVPRRGPTSVVVVPSHELAEQVADLYNLLMADLGSSATVLSSSSDLEISPTTSLLVGTPGALARQALDEIIPHCDAVVFDEADALLGSSESQVWQIVTMFRHLKRVKPRYGWRRPRGTPSKGPPQLVFCGATVPAGTKKSTLERIHIALPAVECVRTDGAHALVPTVEHTVIRIEEPHTVHSIYPKLQVLRTTLAELPENVGTVLIFANTVARAQKVAEEAPKWGWRVAELHKKVTPDMRRDTVAAVTRGDCDAPQLVIATDLAARGLDIPTVTHVVQFDFAPDVTSFIHRVGRTARNGCEGRAISLVEHGEQLVAEAVAALLSGDAKADQLFDPLFSRKRSFRRRDKRKKKQVEVDGSSTIDSNS
eukprot:m.342859 g.342859  ORF g.342859 m.342859 type:complete len:562 (+) comp27862_c0_seq2:217-1902(+)